MPKAFLAIEAAFENGTVATQSSTILPSLQRPVVHKTG